MLQLLELGHQHGPVVGELADVAHHALQARGTPGIAGQFIGQPIGVAHGRFEGIGQGGDVGAGRHRTAGLRPQHRPEAVAMAARRPGQVVRGGHDAFAEQLLVAQGFLCQCAVDLADPLGQRLALAGDPRIQRWLSIVSMSASSSGFTERLRRPPRTPSIVRDCASVCSAAAMSVGQAASWFSSDS